MLTALHIENIAIIDCLDLEFQKGFTVLTGETGAGKSIIIDSILLLLGGKASRELIRSGAESGVVSACFSELSPEAVRILSENGLSPDEDGNMTVLRRIGADGRNNARINGISVTVSLLKELGAYLINIHGQHDGVLLLDSRRHIRYLDEFGGIEADRQKYHDAYLAVKMLREQLEEAQRREAEKNQRRILLADQLARLEECGLREGEYEALLERRKNLMAHHEITEGLQKAAAAVYDGEAPAAQLVHDALEALTPLKKLFPQGESLAGRLEEISLELDDLGAELGKIFDDYAEALVDPEEIERRLDQLEQIKKEFGPTDRDVLECQKNSRMELEALDNSEEILHHLESRYAEARNLLQDCAALLTKRRKDAAERMEKQLLEELIYLDMPKVRFQIRVVDRINERGGIRYRAAGKDDVEFFLSANAGEAPRPLARIASGGELSRIMLSMKSVLNQDFDTVVYDEVDTGVSGATAEKIGKKLQSGAENRQVFCITHLAQIAARADHHFKVVKSERSGRVYSEVQLLDHAGRVGEIARIMGGEELTKTLLQSAEEILSKGKNKD